MFSLFLASFFLFFISFAPNTTTTKWVWVLACHHKAAPPSSVAGPSNERTNLFKYLLFSITSSVVFKEACLLAYFPARETEEWNEKCLLFQTFTIMDRGCGCRERERKRKKFVEVFRQVHLNRARVSASKQPAGLHVILTVFFWFRKPTC